MSEMAKSREKKGKPVLGKPLSYDHYDKRGYRTVAVEAGYAGWSKVYGDFDRRFDLDLLESSDLLAEQIPGSRVIDLGCGTGRIGAWLKSYSAGSVCGVDLSAHMLAKARERAVYDDLVQADLCATGLPGGSFDGALTSMALCHLPDLDRFFHESRRLLREGGWLALVDYHPFFLFSGVPSHYKDPDQGVQVAIENYIHALSQYFQSALTARFQLREFTERFVTDQWAADSPSYAKYLGWPITFMMVFE
jgi:ubiquinone/menaquinone biosynthesis C-methylase UbiE